ncbi:MAG: hypothetical protein K8R25_15680 [Methanosarcinales archaeon]|nr:hypothetical protein [Methanosarcinales archaeon]
MEVRIDKKGLLIPHDILHSAKIFGNVDIRVGEKEVIIKEKNITRSLKGYCGKLRISPEDMKELYLEGLLEKNDV